MRPDRVNRANVRIVLQRPRFPENIGAAARAMRNMGFRRLAVVQPENFNIERIRMMATHAAGDVVDAIVRFDHLSEALRDCRYVVGTTARLGGERPTVVSPSVMAQRLVPICHD